MAPFFNNGKAFSEKGDVSIAMEKGAIYVVKKES